MPPWATPIDSGPTAGTKRRGLAPGTTMKRRVRASFERLRASPTFHVRRGPGVVVEPRPAVSGHEIVLEQRIVGHDFPAGIRFVRDVDVIALIDLAPRYSDVPDLFDAYCRKSGPASLPDVLRALATALARGWLVAE